MKWTENISNFYRKLKVKYTFIVLDDDTLQEQAVINATPLRFFVSIFSILILVTVLITILISFTPLREYIPGYSDLTVRRNAITNAAKADSLETVLYQKDIYLTNIINILQGKDSIIIAEEEKEEYQKTLSHSLQNNKTIQQ